MNLAGSLVAAGDLWECGHAALLQPCFPGCPLPALGARAVTDVRDGAARLWGCHRAGDQPARLWGCHRWTCQALGVSGMDLPGSGDVTDLRDLPGSGDVRDGPARLWGCHRCHRAAKGG